MVVVLVMVDPVLQTLCCIMVDLCYGGCGVMVDLVLWWRSFTAPGPKVAPFP